MAREMLNNHILHVHPVPDEKSRELNEFPIKTVSRRRQVFTEADRYFRRQKFGPRMARCSGVSIQRQQSILV